MGVGDGRPAEGEVSRPVYHRVLLKLSGDAFSPPDTGYGISTDSTALLARELRDVVDIGVQVAVVVGGGNIWRGRAEPYIPLRAVRHLEKGRIVIFAAGMGAPFFSTDTTAAQRALEIGAEVILKGTKVDGVYSADPLVDPNARRFESIEYLDVLREGYQVMDATAISLSMENKLPIIVFDFRREGNIRRALSGEPIGTLVHGGAA